MKILLTGHKGFIGSHMLTALQNLNHEVVTFEWGDPLPVVDESLDWVIHLGAISSTTERNVQKIMMQNYDFSVLLYDACHRHNVNFQYASSASVYGSTTHFSEFQDVDPRTPYAWSKYMFERYTQKHAAWMFICHGFRYFNVYGPEGEDHKGDQASPFYKFKKQQEETGLVKVFENSDNYKRDFVHVSEIVDTHLKFFNVKESSIWNVGTGSTMSFLDVAKKYSDNIVEIPMPDNLKTSYQEYTCADLAKLKDTYKRYGL